MAKLKVYRTPAGFYDAYVAATSQKAALEAWGSDADLFARGIAEVVTDAALTKEPLAKPGEIIKRARTAADAAPEPPPRRRMGGRKVVSPEAPPAKAAKPAPKPKPRPSRAKLDAAEQALTAAAAEHAAALADLKREEADLARRRRALETARDADLAKREAARDRMRKAYDAALEKWRG